MQYETEHCKIKLTANTESDNIICTIIYGNHASTKQESPGEHQDPVRGLLNNLFSQTFARSSVSMASCVVYLCAFTALLLCVWTGSSLLKLNADLESVSGCLEHFCPLFITGFCAGQ